MLTDEKKNPIQFSATYGLQYYVKVLFIMCENGQIPTTPKLVSTEIGNLGIDIFLQ